MTSPPTFQRLAVAATLLVTAWLGVPSLAGSTARDASATVGELLGTARDASARGEYSLAIECYEEILRRDRTNLEAMLELSGVYQLTGKLEYARGLLIRATRIDPGYPGLEQRRAAIERRLVAALAGEVDSLIARGDYESAIPRLSIHNTIDPGNASVHYKRSLCLFEMGRYDAALSDIDVAIAASPQEPYFLLRDRISGEMHRERIRELVAQAQRLARSQDPGDKNRAVGLLARILELEPGHTWAQEELTRLGEADTGDGSGRVAETGNDGETPRAFGGTLDDIGSMLAPAGRFVDRHLSGLIALAVIVLVFRSPLSTVVTRRFMRRPVLAGDLSSFSVAEVLTMLNAEPHTGTLHIRGRSCRGVVYFDGGEPCHCTAGGKQGVDALIGLVERVQKGRFEFISGGIPLQRTIDTPLSILLVEQAHHANGVPVPSAHARPRKSRMKELLESKPKV
jgi:thioredoxin-like negative regulator of GroEL